MSEAAITIDVGNEGQHINNMESSVSGFTKIPRQDISSIEKRSGTWSIGDKLLLFVVVAPVAYVAFMYMALSG